MGKYFKLKLSFIMTALLLVWSAAGCTGYSGKRDGFYGNLDIKVSNFKLSSYAGAFYWDGTKADLQITVPDKFSNVRVGGLGGYYGTGVPDPFRIQVQEPNFALWRKEKSGAVSEEDKAYLLNNEKRLRNYFNEYAYPDPSRYEVPVSLEELIFKLHIGRFVEKLYVSRSLTYIGRVRQDKSIVFYAPVVYIDCSPDNRVFYSKEGRLYRRADDSLVDDFNYPGALKAHAERREAENAAEKAAASEAAKAGAEAASGEEKKEPAVRSRPSAKEPGPAIFPTSGEENSAGGQSSKNLL